MSSNPSAAYLETTVLSASPVKLVYLAYEGAIEAVAEARTHLKEKRIHERSRAITRAQLIVSELQVSLDFRKGGAISTRLGHLYDYMQRRLREANFKQIEEPLADVEGLLETLASAWKEIAANDNPPAAAAASSYPASSPSWASTAETAAAKTFTHTPSASSAYASAETAAVETPAYSWAGRSSSNDNPPAAAAAGSYPASSPSWASTAEPAAAAPAETFPYTPFGSSAYASEEAPAYSWAGSSSYGGRAESAYSRFDSTL